MKHKNFDIVISGAGLAGIISAYAFSQIGLKVALLDLYPLRKKQE